MNSFVFVSIFSVILYVIMSFMLFNWLEVQFGVSLVWEFGLGLSVAISTRPLYANNESKRGAISQHAHDIPVLHFALLYDNDNYEGEPFPTSPWSFLFYI